MAKFIYKVVPIGLEWVNKTEYRLVSELTEESDEELTDKSDEIELMGLDGWELVAIWPNSKEYLDEYNNDDDNQHRFINLGVFQKQVL